MDKLEKIDTVRQRSGLGYAEAKQLLERNNWDVVEALVTLEEEGTTKEKMLVKGSELMDQIKRIIHEGNVNQVRIKHRGRTVVEFPVTFGALGVVIAPGLALVGSLAALLSGSSFEIERIENREEVGQGPNEETHQEEPRIF